MAFESIRQHRSWFLSGAIVVAITLWLISGSDSDSEPVAAATADEAAPQRASVRVRNQVAEEVVRIVSINGRTAPARIVELNAETDGRVVSIGTWQPRRYRWRNRTTG
jgi:hypothetical protein